MVKAVLFDYCGVLTEGGKAGSIQQTIADIIGIEMQELDVAEAHLKLRTGQITDLEFFKEVNRRHPSSTPISEELFYENSYIFAKSDMVYQLAEELRARDIITGIFSNVYPTGARLLRERGLYQGFSPVILSCEEGVAKPDPAFYELACKRLGLRPSEVLFVDDQQKCLITARALGMPHILGLSPQQIVDDIRGFFADADHLESEPLTVPLERVTPSFVAAPVSA